MRNLNHALRLGLMAAAAGLALGAASAQSFTFSSVSDETTNLGATTPAGTVGGAYWTGTTTAAYADGTETVSSFTCVSMTQPPRDAIFMMHGVCDLTAEDGTFTSYMGCNVLSEDPMEMGCVGGLTGKTGAYEGRGGSFTLHAKGETSAGTGQWYE